MLTEIEDKFFILANNKNNKNFGDQILLTKIRIMLAELMIRQGNNAGGEKEIMRYRSEMMTTFTENDNTELALASAWAGKPDFSLKYLYMNKVSIQKKIVGAKGAVVEGLRRKLKKTQGLIDNFEKAQD